MLTNVGDNNRLAARGAVDGLDDLRLIQLGRVVRVALGRVLLAPAADLLQPVGVALHAVGLELRSEFAQHPTDVADDRHIDAHVFADLRRVDVDVDDLGLWGETGKFAARAIVHAHADRYDQVRVVDGVVAVHPAVHAQKPEGQRVILGEAGDAQQRRHDRDLRLLGKAAQLVPGAREQDALAGDDHRAARALDQARGFLDLAHVRLERGLVPGQVDASWILGPLDFRQQDVLGHVDVHRTWAARAGQVEGLAHHPRQIFGVAHEEVLLRYWNSDARDVSFLKGVSADHAVGHVGGNRHQRDRVHVSVTDASHQIRRAWAAGAETHTHGPLLLRLADRSRGSGVAIGHVTRALLVADEDVLQGRELGQDVVQGHDGAARQPEDGGHALFHERL